MATNRLGFHYYPDDRHYTEKDLAAWLPALSALGAKWLTLRTTTSRAVPETFVRGLLEAGITPIVLLPACLTSIRTAECSSLFEAYAHWGVRHVVIGDRPNTRAAWEPSEWGRPALVERCLDRLIPILQAQRAAGLHPVLPALEPGGDYWDTAFLSSMLAALQRRGQQSLLRDLALGMYAWSLGRPLDWGRGGAKAWPSVRPYQTPDDVQDQRGFRAFDWYAQIAQETIGRSLPMLVVGGGIGPSWDPDSESETAELIGMARALASADVPDTLLAFNLYLLCAEPGAAEHSAALYAEPNSPRAAARALFALASEPTSAPAQAAAKTIGHYLLLPTNGTLGRDEWNALAEYVLVWRPVIGFSVSEASLASEVTLVGDSHALPISVENELSTAGCVVRRVIPQSAPVATMPPASAGTVAPSILAAGARNG
ncbi:MAG: hypothetical protein NTU91_16230 [Chloroflexi bacterium]|nr:hypothetical protein [Chloroflexota bacterium]